jgi:hypothetical protein
MALLFIILIFFNLQTAISNRTTTIVYQEFPPGCDEIAAQKCEHDLLQCGLFNGPADDPTTKCNCGTEFYGECIRLAGCETHPQVGALTKHEIYMKTCVDFIIQYDCPSSLICALNCASDTVIDPKNTKVIPFNNYGNYYLRVRICRNDIHQKNLDR